MSDTGGPAAAMPRTPAGSGGLLPEKCNAIWIGERLGPMAAACLGSFVRAGHEVVLHVYDEPVDVPEGVTVRDAGLLIPADRIIRYRESGSYALFADLFRYRLQEAGEGLYIDCDLVCVRPICSDAAVICGEYVPGKIANGVLKLPPDSPVLPDLLGLFDKPVFAPPWFSWRHRMWRQAKGLVRYRADVTWAGWGQTGPVALTWYMQAHGLASLAQPPEVFYPVPMTRTDLFLDPKVKWDDLITPRTLCVHLWNEMFRRTGEYDIPRGSPLRLLLDGDWPAPAGCRRENVRARSLEDGGQG